MLLPNVIQKAGGRERYRVPLRIALVVFLGIAGFFLWTEHRAHLFGALPYALLLACLAVHFFMHGAHGHAGAGGKNSSTDDHGSQEKRGPGGV